MTARVHAVKILQNLTAGTVSHRQQLAYEKVQHAALPGAPPVPCAPVQSVLPLERAAPQVQIPCYLGWVSLTVACEV